MLEVSPAGSICAKWETQLLEDLGQVFDDDKGINMYRIILYMGGKNHSQMIYVIFFTGIW